MPFPTTAAGTNGIAPVWRSTLLRADPYKAVSYSMIGRRNQTSTIPILPLSGGTITVNIHPAALAWALLFFSPGSPDGARRRRLHERAFLRICKEQGR